jgi:hypothetical protein
MRLKELLQKINENPVASLGDWQGFKDDFQKNISKSVFDLLWTVAEPININGQEFLIAQLNDDTIWVTGYYDEIQEQTKNGIVSKDVFKTVFQINFQDHQDLGNKLGYEDLYSVRGVEVAKDYQGLGLTTKMYDWFVNRLGINILSDRVQYNGGRMLWKKLSKNVNLQVDIIDTKDVKILEKSIDINFSNPNEYDKKYWSEDDSKENIRFVLTKIKD